MAEALVIIPTYNEKENVENMIRKVFSLPAEFDLLIVDDGSPDGTATIVKSLMTEYPDRLFIEERKGKLGLGTAYIHGFKWGLKRAYEFFFEMDCDFSHNPDDLVRLYIAAKDGGADVAIGSRYVRGGRVENWPWGRILMSYFASVYVRLVLWMNIKDTTAGFKCYKRAVLENIALDDVRFIGYAFQIEMKYRAWRKKYQLIEVPITFTDRIAGSSKMSSGIFKEAFIGVVQMRFSL
ncbi:MAG: polyprenol monophosphomannose synthase [Flavobacteriales bacterium]|nr:polyprenol monophosphomannose synthase [Flavobacteriales bacterium]NCG28972.1 glycosyltransferase [Bacteroidota bacterium]MBT3963567.1 polyprenol monophosphomannose synthase [Flavobacteriales bacterium]MBT4706097.1 polyprenol monophosphomannose synthase [Flavobacteriales bacterium]MBT4930656.1 polyprenol monophosphomannose synthase [Flavobacteriales bacterium]